MISNEERRKVAEQLRSIPSVDYFGHESINPRHLWETIGFLRTVDGRIPTYEVEHLAALIDRPTCKNDAADGTFRVIDCDSYYLICSSCAAEVELTGVLPDGKRVPFFPSYCPICGAEVIE